MLPAILFTFLIIAMTKIASERTRESESVWAKKKIVWHEGSFDPTTKRDFTLKPPWKTRQINRTKPFNWIFKRHFQNAAHPLFFIFFFSLCLRVFAIFLLLFFFFSFLHTSCYTTLSVDGRFMFKAKTQTVSNLLQTIEYKVIGVIFLWLEENRLANQQSSSSYVYEMRNVV